MSWPLRDGLKIEALDRKKVLHPWYRTSGRTSSEQKRWVGINIRIFNFLNDNSHLWKQHFFQEETKKYFLSEKVSFFLIWLISRCLQVGKCFTCCWVANVTCVWIRRSSSAALTSVQVTVDDLEALTCRLTWHLRSAASTNKRVRLVKDSSVCVCRRDDSSLVFMFLQQQSSRWRIKYTCPSSTSRSLIRHLRTFVDILMRWAVIRSAVPQSCQHVKTHLLKSDSGL